MSFVAGEWHFYTALPESQGLSLSVDQSIADKDVDWIAEAFECGHTYPVRLECMCGGRAEYVANPEEDASFDDEEYAFQLTGLDERMRPFVEKHAPHYAMSRIPGLA